MFRLHEMSEEIPARLVGVVPAPSPTATAPAPTLPLVRKWGQYMVAEVVVEGEVVAVRTPYYPPFISAIKILPERKWDSANKRWLIPARFVLDVLEAVEKFFPAEPCEKYYHIILNDFPPAKVIEFDGLTVIEAERKWAKAFSHQPFVFVMAQHFQYDNFPYWQGEVVMRWLGRKDVEIAKVEGEVRELSGYEEAKELAEKILGGGGE
jgi:hypothetical protein